MKTEPLFPSGIRQEPRRGNGKCTTCKAFTAVVLSVEPKALSSYSPTRGTATPAHHRRQEAGESSLKAVIDVLAVFTWDRDSRRARTVMEWEHSVIAFAYQSDDKVDGYIIPTVGFSTIVLAE